MMDAWLTLAAERLTQPGAQPAEAHRAGRLSHDAALRQWLARFLDHWLPPEHEEARESEDRQPAAEPGA